jgi:hypothetical protein
LAAVWRIYQKCNLVQFGPAEEDNFIFNKASGDKVFMQQKGGSYVLAVEMVVELDAKGCPVF